MESIVQKINPLHLDDLKNPRHPASFVQTNDYQVLILRDIILSSQGLETYSNNYLIINRKIYKVESDQTFIELEDGMLKLHKDLASLFERQKKTLDHYSDQVDQLEDDLYDRNPNRLFMDIWVDLKKDTSKLGRINKRNMFHLNRFIQYFLNQNDFPSMEFSDVSDDLQSLQSTIDSFDSRLDVIHHYSTSIRNDRLNKNIYFLTAISAIFLPLNLIVGFFGMNTSGLFLQDTSNGTMNVIWLLVLVFTFSIIATPTLRWIDRIIIKNLLKKRDFHIVAYKKIQGLFKS